jgi:opacity protein-like surface antigen
VTRTSVVLAAVLLVGLATPSFAQNEITLRGFADAGLTVFTASQSFKAILGSASGPTFGGGIEVGLTRNVFVSLAASRFRRTGHRVFVFENEVFKLDVPDTITVTPLELSGRYRFGGFRTGTFTPYVGGGIGWYRFAETSGHSTTADDVTATHTGYHVLAGVETPIRNWIAAAVDAKLSTVPDAFGDTASSVGSVYNEHNLGGFTVRARIIVGR